MWYLDYGFETVSLLALSQNDRIYSQGPNSEFGLVDRQSKRVHW